jgi:Protein kinase domain
VRHPETATLVTSDAVRVFCTRCLSGVRGNLDDLPVEEVVSFNQVAGFWFVRLLGSGSFAHTYEAERDGKRYAVKVFYELPATADRRERFQREVSSLRIAHPNLAEYAESGISIFGGRPAAYIAMRYRPGASLGQRLLEVGRFPWAQAVEIARGVATGLSCLHKHGVVHRDLKPANIYLPADGSGALILDFGLARLLDRTAITAHGAFVGTRLYSAPEQIRGEADIHSDLYALGATLYEMLTGNVPLTADNDLELIEKIRYEVPEPPTALEPSVPGWLDQLVLDLLAKEPVQRPHSAQAVLNVIDNPSPHMGRAVRAPYDRDQPPLLAIRVSSASAARAVLDSALVGSAPDIAIASITQPKQLDELHRARAAGELKLAVDTRILDTATGGHRSVAALNGRAFAPPGPEPHTPVSLRPLAEIKRVARGDVQEQLREGASLLHTPAFVIDSPQSEWLQRNPRLLEAALDARDALAPNMPMYAQVPCTIDALLQRDHRLSIVNRFARGEPDGYWLGIAGIETYGPDQVAAGIDFALLLQHIGVPCLWTLPGTLAEFAWSCGVIGVEVTLGRNGGFRVPAAARQIRRFDQQPRFELPSLMTSVGANLGEKALISGSLPECECPCPSCQRSSSVDERLAQANQHNLWCWMELHRELAQLDASQRLERYRFRLQAAQEQLKVARKAVPELRSLRNLQLSDRALALVLRERMLDTGRRLRRAS